MSFKGTFDFTKKLWNNYLYPFKILLFIYSTYFFINNSHEILKWLSIALEMLVIFVYPTLFLFVYAYYSLSQKNKNLHKNFAYVSITFYVGLFILNILRGVYLTNDALKHFAMHAIFVFLIIFFVWICAILFCYKIEAKCQKSRKHRFSFNNINKFTFKVIRDCNTVFMVAVVLFYLGIKHNTYEHKIFNIYIVGPVLAFVLYGFFLKFWDSLWIFYYRPFWVGDRVKFSDLSTNNEITGIIEGFSWQITTIRLDYNKTLLYLTNSSINSMSVQRLFQQNNKVPN